MRKGRLVYIEEVDMKRGHWLNTRNAGKAAIATYLLELGSCKEIP